MAFTVSLCPSISPYPRYSPSISPFDSNTTNPADTNPDSLQYLPVAEVILLTFTIPIFTAYACSLFLSAPFEKTQLLAGLISFFGVILIARPGPLAKLAPTSDSGPPDENIATSAERLSAVLLGLLGVLGAVCAYTTIRVIGP